jgi:hypothetical protein
MLTASGPGLGFILAPLGQEVPGQYPNQIEDAIGGSGSYLCPPDPQFNQNGEAGLYYDTALGGLGDGGIPTDAELAKVYGYTPVIGGWINAAEGYFPAPWIPPGGWNAAGGAGSPYGPQVSLSGLRGASDGSTPSWLVVAVVAVLGLAGWWAYREFQKPVRA